MKDLMRIVGRAAEITGSYGRTRTRPERIDGMTRAMLIVEHVNQELTTFIRFIYRAAPNGRLLHVQPDGKLAYGICTPWRGASTLTRKQRDMIRRWLLLKAESRLRPPFVYDPESRRWHLDVQRYPTLEPALVWLERHRMTAGEWLNLA
jgi:hypothetical protein